MEIAKDDKGKPKLSLVPTQIVRDIAQVREYGCKKYNDPENWRKVEIQRYIDAFYRHWLSFMEDTDSIDQESGIQHYKHCACNMAFICELMKEDKQMTESERQFIVLRKLTREFESQTLNISSKAKQIFIPI